MTKEVVVTINGIHHLDGEDVIETKYQGNYYLKNGTHYIFFDEVAENGNIIKNSVKIASGKVEVSKRGDSSYKIVYEASKDNVSNYITPYGIMKLGISTENVEIKEKDDAINVRIKYSLCIENEYLSDCEVDIDIKSKYRTGGNTD